MGHRGGSGACPLACRGRARALEGRGGWAPTGGPRRGPVPTTPRPLAQCSTLPLALQVNNAGITRDTLMMKMKPEQWQVTVICGGAWMGEGLDG